MNVKTDAELVYQHPDGFTLAFKDNVPTATDDKDNPVCLPIEPLGLVSQHELLTAIGKSLEAHGC